MRAVVLDTFGPPEVLRVRELPAPSPGPGQIRLAVHAAGTNPVDASNRADGSWAGLRTPCVLGYDVAGVVDRLGPGVSRWAVGDRVMAMMPFPSGAGGYAELAMVAADQAVALDPGVSFTAAGAAPLAGSTALAVLDRLAPAAGDVLLVLGASGGVGSFLVAMAADLGVRVLAVGSAGAHGDLLAAGATACIDYRTEDIARRARELAAGPVDAIADLVGGESLAAALPALKDRGSAAAIETPDLDLDALLDRNLTLHGVLVGNDVGRLARLARLLAAGVIRPRIARLLPLESAAEAHRLLESRHSGGKVVLQVRIDQVPTARSGWARSQAPSGPSGQTTE